MHIERLEIRGFGRIKGLVLELNRGMNIIYGSNEAGKTSIQWFIRGMLYGLKGGRALKGEVLPPLKRYRPWNGAEYGGLLEYCLDSGERYRIERDFDRGSVRVFDAFFNDITNSFMTGRDREPVFAEQHLGLDQSCFEKTVFIRQMESRIDRDGGGELVNRLVNLSQTGFEDMSFRKAEKALRNALKNCVGTDRTTVRPLDKVMERLDELRAARENLVRKREDLLETEKRLREAQSSKALLENKLGLLRDIKETIDIRLQDDRYRNQEAELSDILDSIRADNELMSRKAAEFEKIGRRMDEALKTLDEKNRQNKKSEKMPAGYASVFFIILAALFVIAGVALNPYYLAVAAAAAGLAAYTVWTGKKRETGRLSALGDIQRELADLKHAHEGKMQEVVRLTNQIKDRLGRASLVYGSRLENEAGIEAALESMAQKRLSLNERLKVLTSDLKLKGYCCTQGVMQEVLDKYEIGKNPAFSVLKQMESVWEQDRMETENAINRINLAIKEYETILKTQEYDSDELQRIDEEMDELEGKRDRLEGTGISLKLALDVLTDASLELQRDFVPALNAGMSSIMGRLSGLRYKDLRADDRLLLKLVAPETGDVADVMLLSNGTVDQAYMALRLAMAQLIEGKGEKLPLIMDEVFSQYDDERTREAFRLFGELCAERQILVFTCKSRETDIAKEELGGRSLLKVFEI